MHRHSFIGVSLLVSILAINPLIATELQDRVQTRINSVNQLSGSIAAILHKRGLDEDAADEIADSLVDGKEVLLTQMVDNLAMVLPHEEIVEHLSTIALHRKEIRLDSYDHLVNMVSQIKKRSLDKNTLGQLNIVAKLNSQLIG
ncbi:hypothetical protein [Sulfurovum riftiae]|uniref:Uncharacterized protein n=1 Tax=Sulfurovum riftiae TaxID=1630136 RepID=A0A151CDV6_9BACT|nr:hypothetical protein [Sulfurovum riftiae]KYJ85708.1 hypothetical protein AS592_02930 [Sulfurovum riftiae]